MFVVCVWVGARFQFVLILKHVSHKAVTGPFRPMGLPILPYSLKSTVFRYIHKLYQRGYCLLTAFRLISVNCAVANQYALVQILVQICVSSKCPHSPHFASKCVRRRYTLWFVCHILLVELPYLNAFELF